MALFGVQLHHMTHRGEIYLKLYHNQPAPLDCITQSPLKIGNKGEEKDRLFPLLSLSSLKITGRAIKSLASKIYNTEPKCFLVKTANSGQQYSTRQGQW